MNLLHVYDFFLENHSSPQTASTLLECFRTALLSVEGWKNGH